MSKTYGDYWFYHPTATVYGSPRDVDLAFEDVHFESEGHRLHGWFFPAQGNTTPGIHIDHAEAHHVNGASPSLNGKASKAKGTIIHFHGKGGNLTGHFKFVAWLPKLGWNLLVFDYRGFGRSVGKPSRAATIADGHAAIDYLKARPDTKETGIVLFGQSLGAAVGAVVAADRDDLAGILLEGPFASYQGAAQYVCQQSWMTWGIAPFTSFAISPGFDPIDEVARIPNIPKLFVAGSDDTICSPKQALALYERARNPKDIWVIQDGGHLAALVDTDGEGPRRLERFMSECVGKPAASDTMTKEVALPLPTRTANRQAAG